MTGTCSTPEAKAAVAMCQRPLLAENPRPAHTFLDTAIEQFAGGVTRGGHWGWDGASLETVSAVAHDPIGYAGRDGNLCRYVGNGPTGATDPSGLAAADTSECCIATVKLVTSPAEAKAYQPNFWTPTTMPYHPNEPGFHVDRGVPSFTVWVVFEGQNLDKCEFNRSKNVNVSVTGLKPEKQVGPDSGNAQARELATRLLNDNTTFIWMDSPAVYRDARPTGGTVPGSGLPAWEFHALPPNTSVNYKGNFVVEATQNRRPRHFRAGQVMGKIEYDISMVMPQIAAYTPDQIAKGGKNLQIGANIASYWTLSIRTFVAYGHFAGGEEYYISGPGPGDFPP